MSFMILYVYTVSRKFLCIQCNCDRFTSPQENLERDVTLVPTYQKVHIQGVPNIFARGELLENRLLQYQETPRHLHEAAAST
jgi:hypothetical protein